jgi:hypothetical protein
VVTDVEVRQCDLPAEIVTLAPLDGTATRSLLACAVTVSSTPAGSTALSLMIDVAKYIHKYH